MKAVSIALVLGSVVSTLGEIILPYKIAIIKQAEPDKSFGPQTQGILFSPAGEKHKKPLTAISTLVSFKTKYNQAYNLTFFDGPSASIKGVTFFRVNPIYDFDPRKVTWNKDLNLLRDFAAIDIRPTDDKIANKIPFTGFEDEVHFALTPDLYDPDGKAQDIVWTSTANPASGIVLDTAITK